MKISIIFENSGEKNLISGWGLSALVEKDNETILFDTGLCGSDILTNLEVMGFNITELSKVVISHFHWDHTGGIFQLLKVNPGMTFFLGKSFGEIFAEEIEKRGGIVNKGKEWRQLADEIYLTPELKKNIPEQALVINNKDFVFLLLGCSHPGVENFVEITYQRFKKPLCFAGGFHFFPLTEAKIKKKIKKINEFPIRRVFPMHCTGKKGIELLKEAFPVSELATGDTITEKDCLD